MRTLELMIQNVLDKNNYTLNSDLTDIEGVIEYLEMCNEHSKIEIGRASCRERV